MTGKTFWLIDTAEIIWFLNCFHFTRTKCFKRHYGPDLLPPWVTHCNLFRLGIISETGNNIDSRITVDCGITSAIMLSHKTNEKNRSKIYLSLRLALGHRTLSFWYMPRRDLLRVCHLVKTVNCVGLLIYFKRETCSSLLLLRKVIYLFYYLS
jgi:hypothetical protein